jgi:hypothetical protein
MMLELIIVGAAVALAAGYVIFKAVKAVTRPAGGSGCAGCHGDCGECTMAETAGKPDEP